MEPQFKNFKEMQRHFATELTCAQYLEEQRWGGKPECPHCGSEFHSRTLTRLKHSELKGYKDFRCKACDKKYSVLTGSIFESSKIDLKTWFSAMYILSAHKKGISSLQLGRDLGVSQKTAWFMLHRLRSVFEEDAPEMLSGTVQADETYVGGKNKNRHANKKVENSQGRSAKDKTPVVGFYEKDGKVQATVVENTSAETLCTLIDQSVATDAIMVTDAYRSYSSVGKKRKHVVVKDDGGYVKDNQFHTQNIENFWSLLKRGIIGIYHYTSAKHLQRYCDEFAYRYNTRGETDADRFTSSLGKVNGRLRYDDLVGE